MRVAFVEDILRFSIPLGITTIAGMLRDGGHDVAAFVVADDLDGTIERVEAFTPDAVALSVLSGSHLGYMNIARALKQRLGVPIIWGGPHPTFFPEIIKEDCADAVCIGEGEEAALAFANAFDELGGVLPTGIPNFWVKLDGEIHRNPVRPRNRNLDDLPYPARDLYYDQFPMLKSHGIKHFMAHRGCPYKCTYCFNHSYNKLYSEQAGEKKVLHSRSPDSIVDEVLWLQERVPLKMVSFVDDVFTLHRRWTLDFAEIYGKRCGIPFSVNTRFDNVDEEIVSALSNAGLRLVYAGVEGGNEWVRNTLMKRQMSVESMVEAAELYRKYDVKLLTENVIGNPGETFEMVMETLELNIKVKPDIANASVFTPYPKLEMTQFAIDNGYFDGDFDKLSTNYYHGTVIEFDDPKDKLRILNLRCFFSMLPHHPGLMRVVRPLLELPLNSLYRKFGDLVDGYYLRKGMAYNLGFTEFLTTLRHFLTNYRGMSKSSRSASAKQAGAQP
jgi:anaerobic magnesium-protoporphyrin IX monomethyl ester cyclase